MIDRRLALAVGAVVALVTLSMGACGGGTTPTSTPPVTQSPVAGPTPPSTPASMSCPLGKGTANSTCGSGANQLQGRVDAAIDRVVAAHPEYFVLNEEQGQGSSQYRVREGDAFIEAVLAVLQGQGMCAFRIPESNAIQVKSSNDLSEEYEMISGRGFIHRGTSACLRTCSPANFPLDVGDPVARVYVGIFRFRCVGGVTAPPTYENRIPIACDAVITATPKDKDGQNVPWWLHSMNVEFWVRNGEGNVVVIGDVPDQPFNKWVYPKGVGSFSICAAVDGRQTCMNAQVIP